MKVPIAALAAQRIPSHLMDARRGRGLHSWSFATTTTTSLKFLAAECFSTLRRAPEPHGVREIQAKLLDSAATRRVSLVVIVGEIRGNAMFFPDGTSTLVAEMKRPGVHIAIVGCNSANGAVPPAGSIAMGMGTILSYADAIGISQNISTETAKRGATLRSLMLHLQNTTLKDEGNGPAGAAKFIVHISLLSTNITTVTV